MKKLIILVMGMALIISACQNKKVESYDTPTATEKQQINDVLSQLSDAMTLRSTKAAASGTLTSTYGGNASYTISTGTNSASIAITYNNWKSELGIMINGTVNLSESYNGSTYSIVEKASLNLTGTVTTTIGLEININYNGSSFSYSGTITFNGKRFKINSFGTVG